MRHEPRTVPGQRTPGRRRRGRAHGGMHGARRAATRRRPRPRRAAGETSAHLLLKRLALFWAQKQGYHSCAYEVSLPNCRYRADLAAYMPSKGRIKVRAQDPALPAMTHRVMVCHTLGNTAVFECKQARSDFLKDSRSTRETQSELKDLHDRRIELERTLRVHYPSLLRAGDSLVPGLPEPRLRRTPTRELQEGARPDRVVCRSGLFSQTKFDTLVRYRCGNLFYVVAEDGIFQPHEIPLHWGLLVRRADRLELREKARLAGFGRSRASGAAAQDRGQRHALAQPRGRHFLRADLGSAPVGGVNQNIVTPGRPRVWPVPPTPRRRPARRRTAAESRSARPAPRPTRPSNSHG